MLPHTTGWFAGGPLAIGRPLSYHTHWDAFDSSAIYSGKGLLIPLSVVSPVSPYSLSPSLVGTRTRWRRPPSLETIIHHEQASPFEYIAQVTQVPCFLPHGLACIPIKGAGSSLFTAEVPQQPRLACEDKHKSAHLPPLFFLLHPSTAEGPLRSIERSQKVIIRLSAQSDFYPCKDTLSIDLGFPYP